MKKYLLVSLTLLFAAAFLWADEVTNAEQKAAFEGWTKLSWGIHLGSGTKDFADRAKHGFKNEGEWKVTFPLLKEGNKPSKNPADASVYAEVVLGKMSLGFESKHGDNKDFKTTGKVENISGKLWFYGAYLLVYDKPGFKINYASIFNPLEGENKDDKFETGFDGFGTKLGYTYDDLGLDVGIKFGSNGDWTAAEGKAAEFDYEKSKLVKIEEVGAKPGDDKVWIDTGTGKPITTASASDVNKYVLEYSKTGGEAAGNHSKYGMGVDFAIKPFKDNKLAVELGFNTTFGPSATYNKDKKEIKGYNTGIAANHDKETAALGFGAKISSEPVADLNLNFAFDGGSHFMANTKKTFGWDMSFGVGYKKWVKTGIYVAGPATPYGKSKNMVDGKDSTNMAAELKLATEGDLEGLNAGVHFVMYDLLKKRKKDDKKDMGFDMSMKLWVDYKATLDTMWIKPYFTLYGATNCDKTPKNYDGKKPEKNYFGIAYTLGVTYSPLEKVELDAKWSHGKTDKDKYYGTGIITDPVQYKNHLGCFVLSLKVMY